ncbi:MAG: glycosyltransferase family 4 protein [Acidobacteriota bacterium]
MRILLITTFYPPHIIGGWEQVVEECNAALKARSHVTHVLTSTHGVQGPAHEPGIDRVLTLEADLDHYKPASLLTYRGRVENNLQATRKVIRSFNPDVVFVHIMWNLTRGIPWLAEQMCPGRVMYYVADHWPWVEDPHEQYWKDRAIRPVRGFAKRLLGLMALRWIRGCNRSFRLRFERVLCVSHAVRNELVEKAGLNPANLHVVYNGIDIERFYRECTPRPLERRLSLLYAGSLVWHKGVHTAIDAMNVLRRTGQDAGTHLTIIGSGHPDYERQLRRQVIKHGLERHVEFRPRVSRDELADLLPSFDALVFPSTWEEPLARITQEAMASGLVVIGTSTGGTREILKNGETGLTFRPGDTEGLAHQIVHLRTEPGLYLGLARQGQAFIVEKCDLRRMSAEIEAHLESFVSAPSRKHVSPPDESRPKTFFTADALQ